MYIHVPVVTHVVNVLYMYVSLILISLTRQDTPRLTFATCGHAQTCKHLHVMSGLS